MYAKGMKLRNLLLVTVAAMLGPWMICSGVKDYQNSKRLAAEGKTATAQVIDRSVKRSTRGGDRYYLSLRFQTGSGDSVQGRVLVNKGEYSKAEAGGTVSLRYVPSAPLICAVGEPVSTWTSKFVSGTLLLVSGCVLVVLRQRQAQSTRQAAKKVAQSVEALCETHYEYAAVNAQDFSHLDLAWYAASQRLLEGHGFALLGDEENLTFQRTSKGNRTLLRTMLGHDGTWLAYLYHFKLATPVRSFAAGGLKALELQTHFADGTFVTTSNAEAAGKLDSPPGVDALRLPANTPFESILAAHNQRVAASLTNHPGVAAGRMSCLEDVHRVQNVPQQIKAAYRRNTGITKAELQRMAGGRLRPEQIEALHAEVEELRDGQHRQAA